MPARLPTLGCALLGALLSLLAACGPARNEFAPSCPGRAIVGGTSDFDVYRAGGGRDLTDLVLRARIAGMQGSCREGDNKNQLGVSVDVVVELLRGPGMQGRATDVPVFVAVTQGETILDKRIFLMHAVFPSNIDHVTVSPGTVNLSLPVTSGKSGAAYTILAGFQMVPGRTQ